MSQDRLRDEIHELTLKASAGKLGDDDKRRLSELIESSDEACRELLRCAMLDADLMFHARASAAEDRVLDSINLERSRTVAIRQRRSRRSLLAWALPLSAAAAVAVVLLAPSEPEPPAGEPPTAVASLMAQRQPEPIATVTSVPGAQFSGRLVKAGNLFFEGENIKLVKGEVHVSMASGADFVLTSPGEVHFISSKHIKLSKGELSAQVAKWGSGFTVETAAMRVTDLGTRFAIAASSDQDEAHVLQGQVRVQPLAANVEGRRSMLLNEGQALRVRRSGEDAERIQAQRQRFPESAEVFRPYKPISLFNTGIDLAEGDEDPHWRITAGPVGAGYGGPQFGVVATADSRYAPNESERSQWLSVAKNLRPGGLPNSLFTFESTFDLTGFDLETVTVAVQVLADNGVRAIRINGEKVDIEPWDDNQPEQTFSRNRFRLVEIRRGFVPGVNKIEFDVWNGIYNIEGMKADPNPVSLRVEFHGFGRLTSAVNTPDELVHERVTSGKLASAARRGDSRLAGKL